MSDLSSLHYSSRTNEMFYNFYNYVYEYIYQFCNIAFNYCPYYYQLMYFYILIVYYFVRKKQKKNFENENSQYNTVGNFMYLSILNFFKKFKNIVMLWNTIILFFKKYTLGIKIIILNKSRNLYEYYLIEFKNKHFWLTWKPVFKKSSYYGLFSAIRTKWFKYKK